jgi:hypothetical protein
MDKNKQLITSSSIIDTSTGEIISGYEKAIQLPEKVAIDSNFIKIHERALNDIESKKLGHFIRMLDFLEYETNRFTKRAVGLSPIPLGREDFENILGLGDRTIGTLFRHLLEVYAIFKIEGFYFCNPTFAMRSKFILTEVIMSMLPIDPAMNEYLKSNDKRLIRHLSK